jgi:hypothetical protein
MKREQIFNAVNNAWYICNSTNILVKRNSKNDSFTRYDPSAGLAAQNALWEMYVTVSVLFLLQIRVTQFCK